MVGTAQGLEAVNKSLDGLAVEVAEGLGGDGLYHRHHVLHTMTKFINEHCLLPFGVLAAGDIVENYADLASLSRTDAKGMNVIPPMAESVRLVFKPNSLARKRHLPIDIEPMLFVFGGKRPHPLSLRHPNRFGSRTPHLL